MTKHTAAAATDDSRLVRRLVMPAIAFAAIALAGSQATDEAATDTSQTGVVAVADAPELAAPASADWPW
ncbi:hypothetical protein KBX26_11490 [Micromonospora sp. C97]|uniref:hypothetical protein n=1 Tax=Micromonospora sp. C97 TaxID=2824883 RepID=UPI001B36867D|nr:hypothetical protein [Micromonospora sp. C97]MBQ1030614.1 hypothetical protein [Micromonospora sp. C97]